MKRQQFARPKIVGSSLLQEIQKGQLGDEKL
jgi:hypothetical protein